MITLHNFLSIGDTEQYDHIYVVVRNKAKASNSFMRLPNVEHLPILSPSWELFLGMKGNAPLSLSEYYRTFYDQMMGERQQECLQDLANRSHTEKIAIVCFCMKEEECHRSMLGHLLKEYNALVLVKPNKVVNDIIKEREYDPVPSLALSDQSVRENDGDAEVYDGVS